MRLGCCRRMGIAVLWLKVFRAVSGGGRRRGCFPGRRPTEPRKDTRRVTISLVLVRSSGEQREVPIKKVRIVIGRKPGCDVRVGVPAVSREHCELNAGGGKLTMRDLGSSNGTYVNGQRVQDAILGAGDILAVGPAVFVVRVAGKPAEIDGPAAMQKGLPKAAATGATAQQAGGRRPAAPGGGAAAGKPKPGSSVRDDDLLTALGGDANDASSIADFDFDLDDDDEKKQPKL